MKTGPVVPAPPARRDMADRTLALAQARQVFLGGNGLPGRWRGRERFTVLATGFGAGDPLLATWAAWRDDPHRARRLHLVAVVAQPPTAAALAGCHAGSPLDGLAAQWQAAWPPAVHGLHLLRLDDGAVSLQLAFGDPDDWLPALVLQADAFYLDGAGTAPTGDAHRGACRPWRGWPPRAPPWRPTTPATRCATAWPPPASWWPRRPGPARPAG
ncbi:MnmC family methyltransferase [Aquabacterium sp. J223]|uniref:MnmC family methyltransferase n=1 Tax=Aquabacterium sp. J223 TaxID=2898431 RepID=UPI0021AD928E|nr:MnmC family methyltransferase [Aquabacterium sp. J223]UUX97086.1 hypothetical protein LRS07_07510 [Aquabacterium sp. J223]